MQMCGLKLLMHTFAFRLDMKPDLSRPASDNKQASVCDHISLYSRVCSIEYLRHSLIVAYYTIL